MKSDSATLSLCSVALVTSVFPFYGPSAEAMKALQVRDWKHMAGLNLGWRPRQGFCPILDGRLFSSLSHIISSDVYRLRKQASSVRYLWTKNLYICTVSVLHFYYVLGMFRRQLNDKIQYLIETCTMSKCFRKIGIVFMHICCTYKSQYTLLNTAFIEISKLRSLWCLLCFYVVTGLIGAGPWRASVWQWSMNPPIRKSRLPCVSAWNDLGSVWDSSSEVKWKVCGALPLWKQVLTRIKRSCADTFACLF